MTEQIVQTSAHTPTKRPKVVFANQLLFESNTISAALTDKLGVLPLAIPITLAANIQTDHIREATQNAYDCLALLQKEVPDADLWVSYYRCVHPDRHNHWLVCGVILVQNRFCKEGPVLVHTAGIPIGIEVLMRTRSLGFQNTTIGQVLSSAPDSQQSFLKESYTKELAAISESIASAVAIALDLLPENATT